MIENTSEPNTTEIARREEGDICVYDRGKKEAGGKMYERFAIKTHFVEEGEDYVELFRKYVSPLYKSGDFVTVSEKVISMCQNNTVKMEDVHVGWWAKTLSKFATSNEHGIAMDEPYKLQLAIDMKGLPLILWACVRHVFGRLVGKRGVFYEVVGQDVSGIDGFYSHSSFDFYHTTAVLIPKDPNGVCKKIEDELGIATVIVDANDLNVEVLGKAPSLSAMTDAVLAESIFDNPAGQDDQLTPLILVRAAED